MQQYPNVDKRNSSLDMNTGNKQYLKSSHTKLRSFQMRKVKAINHQYFKNIPSL